MTKQDALEALELIREQLSKLPTDDTTQNAFTILSELWNQIEAK